MSRKKLVILLCAVAFLALAGTVLAGSGVIQVYLDARPVPVKTVNLDGEIYVSLTDLAKIFPNRMTLDTGAKRLDIISSGGEVVIVKNGAQPSPQNGIAGEVSVKGKKKGEEVFLKNVNVYLYSYNKEISDDMSQFFLQQYAAGIDNSYPETHGKVRETVTGPSGDFYMADVPEGKYELTAIYYTVKGKTGICWRKVIEVKREQLLKVKFNSDNSSNFGF